MRCIFVHFYTSLGLAWKAALKYIGMKLELLRDYNVLLMFEKGIQGGITQAVHCYAKTNNKYVHKFYKSMEQSSSLQRVDANNPYEWAIGKAFFQTASS